MRLPPAGYACLRPGLKNSFPACKFSRRTGILREERTVFMEKTAQPRPFGLRDKIGYLFGDFGNDFTFSLSTVILSKF